MGGVRDGRDPLYYTTQVATYMALLGFDDWDVAVLFGTSDFRIYRLHRDLELENMILERAREFWNTYVVGTRSRRPIPRGRMASTCRKSIRGTSCRC